MATIVDITLLQVVKPVFTLIFVTFVMFAILEKTKIFGNAGVNGIISLFVGFLFILTPGVAEVIETATPWFFILFFLIIFIVLTFMMVGVKEESVVNAFSDNWVVWIILIITVVGIFGFSVSKVFGPSIQGIYGNETTNDQSFQGELGRTLFHPRLLGMLLILAIASTAVRMIPTKGS